MLERYSDRQIHLVGIKGTGMSSLAIALQKAGALVTGSDVAQRFYTDELLEEHPIRVFETFSEDNIPAGCSLIISSPAYSPDNNAEISFAVRSGIRVMTYVEMLAELSSGFRTCAVAGTHGKSSTSAMIDHLLAAAGIDHLSIYGTALQRRDLIDKGSPEVLCIEACEYRNHFHAYSPDIIILTSISLDHPDFFSSINEVRDSFLRFLHRLPEDGVLIYDGDDREIVPLVGVFRRERPDVRPISYGLGQDVDLQITGVTVSPGQISATVSGSEMNLKVPGIHMVKNMAAAAAAVSLMCDTDFNSLLPYISSYPGCIRRSEPFGEAGGITFVDDYGHHPEEISKTLSALREFYAPKRMIVDFIPHTVSRTKELFGEFVTALDIADLAIIHPVYMTVREAELDEGASREWGRRLTDSLENGRFLDTDESGLDEIMKLLQSGDLFITMGAGNNRYIGDHLIHKISLT